MASVKKVKYVGPYPEAEFLKVDPITEVEEWVTVKRLAQVEVPTHQANRMAEQEDNWTIVDPPPKAEPKAEPKADPKPAVKADTKDEG